VVICTTSDTTSPSAVVTATAFAAGSVFPLKSIRTRTTPLSPGARSFFDARAAVQQAHAPLSFVIFCEVLPAFL
jgi:hypothetical protein